MFLECLLRTKFIGYVLQTHILPLHTSDNFRTTTHRSNPYAGVTAFFLPFVFQPAGRILRNQSFQPVKIRLPPAPRSDYNSFYAALKNLQFRNFSEFVAHQRVESGSVGRKRYMIPTVVRHFVLVLTVVFRSGGRKIETS